MNNTSCNELTHAAQRSRRRRETHSSLSRHFLAFGALVLTKTVVPAQRFEHAYGFPAMPEVGTAMIELTGGLGYAVAGTRNPGALLVGTLFGPNGAGPIELAYAPMSGPGVVPHCMRAASTGGTILGGETATSGLPPTTPQIWLGRFNAAGAQVWSFLYTGSATGVRHGTRVIEATLLGGLTFQRGFAVIGNVAGSSPANRGVFFKVDANGALIFWASYAYGQSPVFFDDLRQNVDGSFTILGRVQHTTGGPRGTLLIHLTNAGVPICAMGYALSDDVEQQALTVTSAGDYVVWGHYGPRSPAAGSFLFKAPRVFCGLPLLWRTEFPGILGTRPTVIEEFRGTLACNGQLGGNGVLLRTNAAGLVPVASNHGLAGASVEELYQVIPTSRGGLACCGSTQQFDPTPSTDVYAVATNKDMEPCCSQRIFPQFAQRQVSHEYKQIQYASAGVRVAHPLLQLATTPLHNERCHCPDCVDPPKGITMWLPLDEAAGSRAGNIANWLTWWRWPGTHVNGPLPSSPADGKVSRSLCFDGVDDHVTVRSYGGIQLGTGDFTIDAWIKLPSPTVPTYVPIVDKRVPPPSYRGYLFFLHNGQVSLQMTDGAGLANVSTIRSTLPTLKVPADGAWHFVAVTVSRGTANGCRFYLDRNSEPFSATGRQRSLDNSPGVEPPLLVGKFSDPGGFPALRGCLDEIEVFRRRLEPEEIETIRLAGSAGKCKERFRMAPARALGSGQDATVVMGEIHNGTAAPATYTCRLRGVVDGPGCTVQGPTSFSPAGPITVGPIAPGASGSFSVTITRPSGMNMANLTGCYDVFVESSSGATFSARGALVDRRDVRISGVGWDGSVTELGMGAARSIGPVTVTNTSGAPLTLNYRLVAMTNDLELDAEALSLNGQPPGTAVSGTVQIGAGGAQVLNALVEFVVPDGLRAYSVRLEADMDGDGTFDFLGARELRSLLGDVGAGAVPYGAGCGGLTLSSTLPVLGSTVTMTLGGVRGGSLAGLGMLGSVQSPGLDLSSLGMTGCWLLVNQLGAVPSTLVPPTGLILLPLPNQSNLIGVELGVQAAVVSPGANPSGVVTSNGVRLILSDT